MKASGGALTRRTLAAGLAIAAVAAPITSADAAVKMKVKGWTMKAGGTSPDVKNQKTIKNCRTDGTGSRRIRMVFEGSGIGKNKPVGMTVGQSEDPPLPPDFNYPWPVGKSKTHSNAYGITFPGPPSNIDGDWFATIWFENEVIARGEVKVKCGDT